MMETYTKQYSKYVSENSEGNSSEVESDQKYIHLENNHRRLLGVTTALTEALENTVRGNAFDLEETLSECMTIYPELFNLQLKKPTKHKKPRKIYNTSVSEDVTDIAESGKKTSLKVVDRRDKLEINSLGPRSDNCEKILSEFSETTIQPIRISGDHNLYKEPVSTTGHSPLPENQRFNTYFDEMVINSISETSQFFIQSPSETRHSFSLHFSDTEASLIKSPLELDYSTLENHPETFPHMSISKPEENDRFELVNKHQHMKNDAEESTADEMGYENSFCIISEQHELSKENNEVIWPYEIIVQQKMQSNSFPNDTNLLIKMLPEVTFQNKNCNELRDQNPNLMSLPKSDTAMTQPAETHIIITKQMANDSKSANKTAHTQNKENLNKARSNSKSFLVVDKDINKNIIGEFERINSPEKSFDNNITIEKLQKLSTALKVQSDELLSDSSGLQYENNLDPMVENLPSGNSFKGGSISSIQPNEYYFQIKQDIQIGSVKEKATILQSLRLKLIHTLAKERASLLKCYAENDILQLSSEPILLRELISGEIINGWDLILQQMTFKLLNTLVSTWKGRDYLTTNVNTIKYLHERFFKKISNTSSVDDISKDMLIAIFHKLSIRQNQQTILINAGSLEKVFYNITENYEHISSYHLRHSLGLLINLCVSSHGRQRLEPMATEILNILTFLLKSLDKKIVAYTTRLMYILMSNDTFHETAKTKKLTNIIDQTINDSKTRAKLQLEMLREVIEQPTPHTQLQEEVAFLSHIEAELEELEEEVEAREPRLASAKADNCLIYDNIPKKQITQQKPAGDNSPTKISTSTIGNKKNSNIPKRKSNQQNPKILNLKVPQDISSKESIKIPKVQKSNQEINKDVDGFNKVRKQRKTDAPTKSKQRKSKNKVQHEIDEKNEFPTNYTLLQEALSNIIDNQASNQLPTYFPPLTRTKDKIVPILNESKKIEKSTLKKNPGISMDISKTFIILPENETRKSSEINKLDSFMKYADSCDIKNIDSSKNTSPNKHINSINDKSRPSSKTKEPYSRKIVRMPSIFSQEGRLSANDYDYCEETKQIQMPLQHDNIFKDNRQSPYKGLLTETHKENNFRSVTPVTQYETNIISQLHSPVSKSPNLNIDLQNKTTTTEIDVNNTSTSEN